jgi:hypothetical protein
MDDQISRAECEARHEALNEFKKETSESLTRIHKRLDGFPVMIIAVLMTIIGSLAVQIIVIRTSEIKETPRITVKVDAESIQKAIDRIP